MSFKQTRWICEAVLFIFAFLFLGVFNAEYLYALQAQNLFLANSVFANETLAQSAGVLVYVSKFLNQFLHYPLLGACFMSAGLVGIERLVARLTTCDCYCRLLSVFVPSLLVLLAQTSAGYAIYDNFDTSFAVSLEVGLLLSLGLANAFRLLYAKLGTKGLAVSTVLAIVLYFAIGIFSPFSLLVASASLFASDRKTALHFLMGGVALLLLLPMLATSMVQEDYMFTLLGPLPVPYFKPLFMLAMLTLVSVVMAIAVPIFRELEVMQKTFVTPACVLALCGLTFYFSFRDANYRTELEMKHCVEDMDFDGALKAAETVKRPTRPIAAYRYIALEAKGRLSTDLFNFPVRYDTINSPYTDITDLIFQPDLMLYSSQPNISLLWGMESWTNTKRTVSDLKRFTLTSLIQGEAELSRKYIGQLKQTVGYSKWAEEFEPYVGKQQELFNAYPVLGNVYRHQLPMVNSIGIYDLPKVMSSYSQLDPVNMERRLLLHLYSKNTNAFISDLQTVAGMYREKMPMCMQEIVALYAMNTKINLIQYFPIKRDVAERVAGFVKAAEFYAKDHENGAIQLKQYQGSYLYFLLFGNPYPNANNLKSNK